MYCSRASIAGPRHDLAPGHQRLDYGLRSEDRDPAERRRKRKREASAFALPKIEVKSEGRKRQNFAFACAFCYELSTPTLGTLANLESGKENRARHMSGCRVFVRDVRSEVRSHLLYFSDFAYFQATPDGMMSISPLTLISRCRVPPRSHSISTDRPI